MVQVLIIMTLVMKQSSSVVSFFFFEAPSKWTRTKKSNGLYFIIYNHIVATSVVGLRAHYCTLAACI